MVGDGRRAAVGRAERRGRRRPRRLRRSRLPRPRCRGARSRVELVALRLPLPPKRTPFPSRSPHHPRLAPALLLVLLPPCVPIPTRALLAAPRRLGQAGPLRVGAAHVAVEEGGRVRLDKANAVANQFEADENSFSQTVLRRLWDDRTAAEEQSSYVVVAAAVSPATSCSPVSPRRPPPQPPAGLPKEQEKRRVREKERWEGERDDMAA